MSVKNPDCQMVQLHPLPYMGGARLQRGIANARAGRFNSAAAHQARLLRTSTDELSSRRGNETMRTGRMSVRLKSVQ